MNQRDIEQERYHRFNRMGDNELMHIVNTHNHQSTDRAMAMQILAERNERKGRSDFQTMFELNSKVLWWARAAGIAALIGIALAIVTVAEGWKW